MDDGTTPLHVAVGQGDAAAVAELLAHGARIDARIHVRASVVRADDSGKSEMDRHNAESTAHMLEPGFRFTGRTPFFGVAERWDPAVAAALLKAGARVDATDDNGWTPLHFAVLSADLYAIRGLLALGADPNAASKAGLRPLHAAMRVGFGLPDARVVLLLLAKGADPRARNAAGETRSTSCAPTSRGGSAILRTIPGTTSPRPSARPTSRRRTGSRGSSIPGPPRSKGHPSKRSRPASGATRRSTSGSSPASGTVRPEGDRAVLELRLPAAEREPSTLAVLAFALEGYDTLTPLPVVVHRTKGSKGVARFEFPAEAARGGGVTLRYETRGPRGFGSGEAGDGPNVEPAFTSEDDLSVRHDVAGRTMEFEILAATRGGKPVPGVAGRLLRVPADHAVRIAGLSMAQGDGPKGPRTTLRYRYRLLPNERWHAGETAR